MCVCACVCLVCVSVINGPPARTLRSNDQVEVKTMWAIWGLNVAWPKPISAAIFNQNELLFVWPSMC